MQFRLKVVRGKPRGHCLTFPLGEFMIGRGPECDIRPVSDLVSRQHCLLLVGDDGVLIRDLGSRNGTLVNGQLVVAEQPLHHGDTLQLGPLVLEVLFGVEPVPVSDPISDTAQAIRTDTLTQERLMGETCEQTKVAEKLQPIVRDPVI